MSLWCSSGAAAVIRQVTCADDDADCDQEDTQAEEGEDDAESDCSGQGEDGKAMSLGRATGLAKLPSVLEWLRCHAVQPVLAPACAYAAHVMSSRAGRDGRNCLAVLRRPFIEMQWPRSGLADLAAPQSAALTLPRPLHVLQSTNNEGQAGAASSDERSAYRGC